jgi:hypothetical protein
MLLTINPKEIEKRLLSARWIPNPYPESIHPSVKRKKFEL